ncbi:MAG: 2Fe-2S iron-sulfur cluster-binding protein [Thermoleophilia bacterium]|nr:2Fe-2S iron-sulfur cluster-binding protein [Thermoleophilia bacterium]
MPDYAPVDLSRADVVEFELNGRAVTAPAGTMLVDACAAHGVEVPIFCYEPRLGDPLGACRMCLVRVEGLLGLTTACSTPVAEEMIVDTVSDEVKDAQDGILELLLENHPLDCPVCDKGGECPLQDLTFRFGPGQSRMIEPKRHFPKPLELSSQIALDRERCISCYRCVRFSQDVSEDGDLTMSERGGRSEITTFTGEAYEGRFTGNVIDLCPVGALTSIPYRFVSRPWDVQNTPSVCASCSVGCNTELTVREGEIKRVQGREEPNWEVEEGWICDVGRWGYGADRAPQRLRQPILRDGDDIRDCSLEEAVAAAGLLLARQPRTSVLLGGDATVEEAFIARELAAGPLPNGQTGTAGVAGAALGPLRALPGAQLGDIDGADLIVVVGGDPANQHPVVELRLRKARRSGIRMLVAGPRAHEIESLGEGTRTPPGRLAAGLAAAVEAIAEAERPIVIWDELDLDAEPDAAAVLADALSQAPSGRQVELPAEVNGAGIRALGIAPYSSLLGREALGGVLAVRADPGAGPGAEAWDRALESAGPVIAIASHHNTLTERATVVVPCSSHYEHEGVLVTVGQRAQRLRPGAAGPQHSAPGWEILIALAHRLGVAPEYRSARSAFAAAAAGTPALAGLDYESLGELGAPIAAPPATDVNGAGAPRGFQGEGLPLVTGRAAFGGAVSHLAEGLASVASGEEAVLHPAEAARLGVGDAGDVSLSSPNGACTLRLRLDESAPQGVVFAIRGVPGGGVEGLLAPDSAPVKVTVGPA